MPTQPPRDANGQVQPHDHPEILESHKVIRRISEKQIVIDGKGSRRISSMAFKPSSGTNGGMSVNIENFIIAKDRDPRQFVTTPTWMGSVWFNVGLLRNEALLVGYSPVPENDCHGEVWGAKTRAQWCRLQQLASWYVEIDGVKIAPEA